MISYRFCFTRPKLLSSPALTLNAVFTVAKSHYEARQGFYHDDLQSLKPKQHAQLNSAIACKGRVECRHVTLSSTFLFLAIEVWIICISKKVYICETINPLYINIYSLLPAWGLSTPHISQPWGLSPASQLSLELWVFACFWPASLWWKGHPASQSECQLAGRGSLDSGEWSLEPTRYRDNDQHTVSQASSGFQ